jgi:hypothetical protein
MISPGRAGGAGSTRLASKVELMTFEIGRPGRTAAAHPADAAAIRLATIRTGRCLRMLFGLHHQSDD